MSNETKAARVWGTSYSKEEGDRVRTLAGTMTPQQIADQIGRTLASVTRYASMNQISLAVAHHYEQWTNKEIAVIHEALLAGKRFNSVAGAFPRHSVHASRFRWNAERLALEAAGQLKPNNYRWTPEQISTLKDLAGFFPIEVIVAKVGRDKDSIQKYASKYKISLAVREKYQPWTTGEAKLIRQLILNGLTLRDGLPHFPNRKRASVADMWGRQRQHLISTGVVQPLKRGKPKGDAHLPTAIRKLLKERGMKQYDLAVKMDVSKKQVESVLSGTRAPTLTTINKVARAFGIPAYELLKHAY